MVSLSQRIIQITGQKPIVLSPLGGGCIGDVQLVTLPGGQKLVAKSASEGATTGSLLSIEAMMLTYLKNNTNLPIPTVRYEDNCLILMDFIENSGALTADSQRHAADHVAALHCHTSPHYGFEMDTVIGGLKQPNKWTSDWVEFFRDQRLLYMGKQAMDAGRLSFQDYIRLENLSAKLDRWINDPLPPALVHGDLWGGNVLSLRDRITGFIDPAIYYADPEIELAFTTLFGTFGDSFFRRYGEINPLREGFFEQRCGLYNLYPLLVHVRLFGDSYVTSVQHTLRKFGC